MARSSSRRREVRGEVEERPRHGGDRDAVQIRALVARDQAHVHGGCRHGARSCRGTVTSMRALEQGRRPPVRPGRAVAQHRVRAHSEDARPCPGPSRRALRCPTAYTPRCDRMQPTRANAVTDRVAPMPRSTSCRRATHPVLAAPRAPRSRRPSARRAIGGLELCPPFIETLACHGAMRGRHVLRLDARYVTDRVRAREDPRRRSRGVRRAARRAGGRSRRAGAGRGARAARGLRRLPHGHVHGQRRRPLGLRADRARARGRGRGRGGRRGRDQPRSGRPRGHALLAPVPRVRALPLGQDEPLHGHPREAERGLPPGRHHAARTGTASGCATSWAPARSPRPPSCPRSRSRR